MSITILWCWFVDIWYRRVGWQQACLVARVIKDPGGMTVHFGPILVHWYRRAQETE